MNGDITLEARWHRRRASKVISPFIIFAVFDVSFRRYKFQINYSFFFTFIVYKRQFYQIVESNRIIFPRIGIRDTVDIELLDQGVDHHE